MGSYKRSGSTHKYTLFSTVSTTVDVNSAAGQKVLSVAATTGLAVGDTVLIDPTAAGGGTETGVIATVTAGVSITLVTSLTYTHTAAQADIVLRQGVYQDVKHVASNGGTAGTGASEVCLLGYKTVAITAASVTDGNGGTVSLYGYINGEDVLLHQDSIALAADNGTYYVSINIHVDDIKCLVTSYLDGDFTVTMSGRPN